MGHVREIDEIFDAISYKKGAAIIRMLQTYLAPINSRFDVLLPILNRDSLRASRCGFELLVVLQKGLVSYIKRYEYENAKTEDLWSVLSEVSGEPVKELMDSWTKQKGYPVVTVQLKSEAIVIEQVYPDDTVVLCILIVWQIL